MGLNALEGSGFVPSDTLQALFAEAERGGGDGTRLLVELNNGIYIRM